VKPASNISERKTAARLYARAIATMLLFGLLLQACIPDFQDVIDPATDKAVAVLDQAIAGLADESADWQIILQDAISSLTDEAHVALRSDLNMLLQRAPANIGTEFRCDIDFIRKRIRQDLINIKAKLLNLPVPDKEPALCAVVPLAVDAALVPQDVNRVEFYGYDFDTTPVQVLLRNGGTDVDVSGFLDRPTPYHLTLNLGGNGVQLSSASQRFLLKWKDREISSIGIIQPATPVCATDKEEFQPNSIGYTPPHTRGDREFDGNGPDVDVTVSLSHTDNSVSALVTMSAVETESDWTTASGSETFTFNYAPKPGWKISQILSQAESAKQYRDDTHGDDTFAGSGPVANYTFVGDTDGDDVGETSVKIDFAQITVELVENKNCVSALAVRVLELQEFISPQTLSGLNSQLDTKLEVSPELQERLAPQVPDLEFVPGIIVTPSP
jgi:hypothetical protein